MRTWHLAPCLLAVSLVACGDDTAGSGGAGTTTSAGEGGATTTSSTPSSSSAGGGDGGGGAATTGTTVGTTTGSGGTGGEGGAPPSWEGVDPLEGAGEVEPVAGGFSFVEGPLWLPSLGVLRWSDIPPERIHQLGPDD